ncbi:hypothetical protein IQ260_02485 [Leptolyngbya cf. ectocarpi LEGE 11479]|uniref:Uncharacterized protein n=1 Tax=Leptolyngbya cf. ectocarpi LEGE 11479 TaxID=1828722 RepID=A0A928ZSN9_LEPEC|nr:hypothetical protein [Leptolyngbya ectocarpi]MBE9065516.1 hypothetical protein [Leptolyngbya cf. ectocarpi LEGE 11479]
MFIEKTDGAGTSAPGTDLLPDYQHETVRHMVFGGLMGVRLIIQDLHQRRYAEPNDWSKPISTGRPNEVMMILTKRVAIAP